MAESDIDGGMAALPPALGEGPHGPEASEATMDVLWSFLDGWQDALSGRGGPSRVAEFLAATEALRERLERDEPALRRAPGNVAPGA